MKGRGRKKSGKGGGGKATSLGKKAIARAAAQKNSVEESEGIGDRGSPLVFSIYSRNQVIKVETKDGKTYVGVVKGLNFEKDTITVGDDTIAIDRIASGEILSDEK